MIKQEREANVEEEVSHPEREAIVEEEEFEASTRENFSSQTITA